MKVETIDISKSISSQNEEYLFSVCTLVTKREEYREMLESFLKKGFTTDICEYLHIDNSEGCTFDAYKGLNKFLQLAQGKYIILCHQDVLIHDHDKNHLLERIQEIENADKNWGILANAGGINFKWIATNLTQGSGNRIKEKRLPLQTRTVDENFIIVKRDANLALSNDLSGFHMYGSDLCMIADILGFNSYIIDFNIIHKSDGNANKSFYDNKKAFIEKYNRALRGRFLATTITRLYISGSFFSRVFCDFMPIKFMVRQYYKFFMHKKRYVLQIKKK